MNNVQFQPGAHGLDAREMASVLRWWRDAGFDTSIDEVPKAWLSRGIVQKKVSKAAEAPPPIETLPTTFSAFSDWLASTQSLGLSAFSSTRVAAFGDANAKIMVMTDLPEAEDVHSGILLSGDVGVLFDKMLGAIGLDRSAIYCAAMCPARPATGRLDEASVARFGEIARHHIRLVAPKRVWLLGQTTSRAVLGVDAAAMPPQLQNINYDGVIVETVASFHPRLLLQNPKRKAKVWADMQILVEGMTA